MTKKKKISDITELLPEGLTLQSVEKIEKLVIDKVNEEVKKKIKGLESKVLGFLNVHMEMIQESALTQLEDSNQEFGRAKMMDQILEALSLEVTTKDNENAMTALVNENKDSNEENDVLISELNEALESNTKLENAVQALNDRLELLQETNSELEEAIQTLSEQKKEPFVPSDKGLVIDANGKVGTTDQDLVDTDKDIHESLHGLVTPEMMRLMTS